MAKFCAKIFLAVSMYVFSPFIGIMLLGITAIRWAVVKLVTRLEPGIGKVLAASSSAPAADDYAEPTMTLFAVSTYEGWIDLKTLQAEFESRVIFARDEHGNLVRPELRQYVTRRLGFSFWKYDSQFSIENHVRIYDGKYREEFEKAAEVTPEMVVRAGGELITKTFAKKQSPWEMHVFYNYKDSLDSPISTALGLRIHHSLADGFSILNLTNDLLNEPFSKPKASCQQAGFCNWLFQSLGFFILAPYQLISKALDAVDSPAWKVKEEDVQRSFNSCVTPLIPLLKVKEAAKLTSTSFTAVILACFASSLTRFMKEAGYDVPKKIHCIMPLLLPGHPGRKMRNHMALGVTKLPVGQGDRMNRLKVIHKELQLLRRSTYPEALFQAVRMAGLCFRPCIAMGGNYATSSLVSNFPGPEKELTFNGHILQSMYFQGGLWKGTCGIGFSGLSCAGNIRFVFGLNEGLVPSERLPASLLATYFMEELEAIKENSII